jgi:hypothetical protein
MYLEIQQIITYNSNLCLQFKFYIGSECNLSKCWIECNREPTEMKPFSNLTEI